MLLSLELASLKRVMDRGEPFVGRACRRQEGAGDKLDLKLNLVPLERYMREGVPTATELAKSFRKVANAMLDAEAEPADAIDRRSPAVGRTLDRARAQGRATSADDTSVEATVGRMDGALKEARLAEVLAQGKKLPPKAALVGRGLAEAGRGAPGRRSGAGRHREPAQVLARPAIGRRPRSQRR